MRHLLLGKIGEQLAVKHLRRQGFRIVETNYRTFLGEIDVIAKEKETLVFVEVKTRASMRYGLPQEAVGLRKQRQVIRAAQAYLNDLGVFEIPCRFDVVAVSVGLSGRARYIQLIRGAFDASSVL